MRLTIDTRYGPYGALGLLWFLSKWFIGCTYSEVILKAYIYRPAISNRTFTVYVATYVHASIASTYYIIAIAI